MNIINFIMNVIFINSLELIYVWAFIFILLSRKDLMEYTKYNIIKFSIFVFVNSIFIQFIKYFNIGHIMINYSIINAIFCWISILLIYKIINIKGIFNVGKFLFLALLSILFIEMLYFPIVYYYFHLNIEYLNMHFIPKILISIPSRVIEYIIIFKILIKKVF